MLALAERCLVNAQDSLVDVVDTQDAPPDVFFG